MKRSLVLTTVLLLTFATAAMAQWGNTYVHRGSTDFYVGAGYSKETNSGAPGGSIGAQGGVNFMATPEVALGAMAGYYVLGKTTLLPSLTGPSVDRTFSLIPVTGQATFMIPTGSTFRPYVDGGAGVYFTRTSDNPGAATTDNRFGWNAGAGFEILSGAMGFGIDAKFHELPKKDFETESPKIVSAMATMHFH